MQSFILGSVGESRTLNPKSDFSRSFPSGVKLTLLPQERVSQWRGLTSPRHSWWTSLLICYVFPALSTYTQDINHLLLSFQCQIFFSSQVFRCPALGSPRCRGMQAHSLQSPSARSRGSLPMTPTSGSSTAHAGACGSHRHSQEVQTFVNVTHFSNTGCMYFIGILL